MERLTTEDKLTLWPDRIWPQDVGVLAVLDGRSLFEPGGRLRIDLNVFAEGAQDELRALAASTSVAPARH